MKSFALTTVLASSIFAGLFGAAGTAHAEHDYVDTDHYYSQYRPYVPHVDTSVHTRTIIVRH